MMVKRIFICLILAALTIGPVTTAMADATPIESIKTTINSVLDTMRDKELAVPEKKEVRREKISSLIKERFNYEEMSKRSLAKHWKKRTAEEKMEFVILFSELLEASYISKIEAYTDEKITYDKETIKGNGKYGVVNTTIVTKSVEIPIDYKLISKKGKWWVYDVVIEGVSFISTYRSQYNRIIIKESYAKLIENMKNKLKKVNAPGDKGAS